MQNKYWTLLLPTNVYFIISTSSRNPIFVHCWQKMKLLIEMRERKDRVVPIFTELSVLDCGATFSAVGFVLRELLNKEFPKRPVTILHYMLRGAYRNEVDRVSLCKFILMYIYILLALLTASGTLTYFVGLRRAHRRRNPASCLPVWPGGDG